MEDTKGFLERSAHLVTRHVARHPYLSALVLGNIAAYGMGPFFVWPALLVALSLFWVLLTSLSGDKPVRSWIAGFLFGFGYFVAGLWWIGNALLIDGNPYQWAYPLAVCGLPLLFSLYTMVACGAVRRFFPGRGFLSFMAFIILMWGAELFRGHALSGFPWNLFGMTWTANLPMLQILSIGGIYFLSLLTLFIFTAPAFAFKGDAGKFVRLSVVVAAIGVCTALYAFGVHRLHHNPTRYHDDIVVQLIQPNTLQEDKWNPDKIWDNYRTMMMLMGPVDKFSGATTRAVILPETALTYHDFQTPQAMAALRGRLGGYAEKNVYLLSGTLLHDDTGYHNSLVVLDKQAEFLQSFDKFHLVPFGEYIPFQTYIPIPTITQFSGFMAGPGPRTLTEPNLPSFSPLICYEVIFPGAVVDRKGPRPDWMVNVTNDAWYGISAGPFQHLAMAQYRAIEEGLPIARAANTGISAVFDAYGRMVSVSGLFHGANAETLLPLPAPETLYSRIHF